MNLGKGNESQSLPIITYQFGYGVDCKRIEAMAVICGDDVVVVVVGGSRRHIGAVAMAVSRPSLKDSSQISASASVICVTGHKDDELARQIALKMAAALNCTVSVTVGIHIDQAGEEDLAVLIFNTNQVIKLLIMRLQDIHR